ncbi:class I SAM-dependent methyltransferase [Sedimentibacter sp.]|uniref:tRNA (adenine(22)-N(1))-methyltransferase n=1 Tax=Sedimentibacter sp. TaxID=1960295 RepID=UPI0028AB11CF|nr:class I SAM-dependent methyltransferase [Sedimentibacter sp.]
MDRLECIKSMVTKCHTTADIGTDHGYVAEMLLNENICEKVIATDLNKGPLDRAIKHLTSVNLHEKCDFRLGSGLTVLKENEADAIIIAGMGGELIADIIEASKNIALKASQLILQPMTTGDKLRQYLKENGFKIIDENIVKELHHYYFVIKAVPGEDEITDEIFYEISKIILEKKDPLMFEYLHKILNVNENIIRSIEKNNSSDYNERAEALKMKNEKIRELMKN